MKTPLPLVIVSGPSGSGKSTVISRLLAESGLPLRLSVSATTRVPRPGERDGVHYHFWTRQQFEEERSRGGFLEWAEVHGNYYGTLRREVEPYRHQGRLVILDIDVQGARQVRQNCAGVVSIFLKTSSLEKYEERLRKRGTETEASIQRRLITAQSELAHAAEYDFQVTNDDLEVAVGEMKAILQGLLEEQTHAR
jgi:guanylate kinase